MIPINELRVGSKVIANGLFQCRDMTVEQIGGKASLSDENRVITFVESPLVGEFLKDILPIELSNSILERCGFVEGEVKGKHLIHLSTPNFELFKPVAEFGYYRAARYVWSKNTFYVISEKIMFLHQLQNLFYTLTGTELLLTPIQIDK